MPTNRSLIRHEFRDVVYRTEREKGNAVIEEIKEYHLRGEPVLVGSIAIEKSERLSLALKKAGVIPARLLELAKAAGLEGPKLKVWAEALGPASLRGLAWLTRAGVTASTLKQLQGQSRYKSLGTSPNGTRQTFLEALLRQAPEGYPYAEKPAADESILPDLLALLTNTDPKHLPLLDYLIENSLPAGPPGGSGRHEGSPAQRAERQATRA